MSASATDLFVGLDVSLAETHICVLDAEGSVKFEAVAASEPSAIAAALAA